MIKQSKRIAALLFAMILVLGSVVIVNASGARLLADVDALTDDDSNTIIKQWMNEVSAETGWDIVVNINSNNVNYKKTEETAYKYAKENGIKNGVLLQIDLGSRELQIIEQGDAMYYFSDDRITSMKTAVVSYMKNDDYYGAIQAFVSNVSYYYNEGMPSGGKFTNVDTNEKYNSKFVYTLKHYGIFIGLGSVVIALIVVLIVSSKYKHHGKQGTYDLTANSSVDLSVEVDEFVTKHVTSRTIRDDDNDSSSGGAGTSRGIGGSSF